MNKNRPNKLDPFAARLDEWVAEGKTLSQMQQGLAADGCVSSLSSLSEYLSRRRSAALERELFERIASGGRMNQELDTAYRENPAPDIERLIQVSKTLIMTLQVQGAANPKLLTLANNMQQTVLTYLSGRTKAELESAKLKLGERKIVLLEEAAERARRTEEVLDANVSAEEQAKRIREIFKKT